MVIRHRTIGILLATLALTLATGQAQAPQPARQPAGDQGTPVVLELFTSEGCSSCPPADTLFAAIAAKQPLPGVRIIPLAFHVDYWDQLGWIDRFSSPRYTLRQNDYSRAWRSEKVYTPQAVVDGRWEFLGSDAAAAERLLVGAAKEAKLPLALTVSRETADPLRATVTVVVHPAPNGPNGPADVMLAITEDDLATEVRRGENRSRHLQHAAVVRRLEKIGTVSEKAASDPMTVSHTAKLDRSWRADRLRAVVFVQEQKSRRILGADIAPL
jgi:hypothetical protein